MIVGYLFIVLAVVSIFGALLAIIGITHIALSGSDAIERDGLFPGTQAPSWSLADDVGELHQSPPTRTELQLVIFADHSLKSFPSVAEGLRQLGFRKELDIIVLLRSPDPFTHPTLEFFGLDHLPVLLGSHRLYALYNVRVMPWVMIIDSTGTVRASSLVNYAWQIDKLWQLATVRLNGARSVVAPAVTSEGRI